MDGVRPWAIRTFGLSKRTAAGAPALRGISLGITPGEVCALLGPPGSGKSTLLRVLATACRADAGSFCLAGHLVTSYPWRRAPLQALRRCVGFLPEEPGHFSELTGTESLLLYAGAHGLARVDARVRTEILLDWAHLSPLAQRRVSAYSYAERRRLALAQALLHRPQVLLLDDPGRGQAPEFRQGLAHLIAQQAAAGTTVILAAPQAAGPEFVPCQRHLRLEGGRLLC